MSRHHNRAILAAISELGLTPNKEYVMHKDRLVLSAKETKKCSPPSPSIFLPNVTFSLEKEIDKNGEETIDVFVAEPVVINDIADIADIADIQVQQTEQTEQTEQTVKSANKKKAKLKLDQS